MQKHLLGLLIAFLRKVRSKILSKVMCFTLKIKILCKISSYSVKTKFAFHAIITVVVQIISMYYNYYLILNLIRYLRFYLLHYLLSRHYFSLVLS